MHHSKTHDVRCKTKKVTRETDTLSRSDYDIEIKKLSKSDETKILKKVGKRKTIHKPNKDYIINDDIRYDVIRNNVSRGPLTHGPNKPNLISSTRVPCICIV